MMNFITEHWQIMIAGVAVLAVAGFFVYRFFNLPTAAQLVKVRQWLLWAVTEAEKDLGSKTGTLKLRRVYDLFVVRFPWLVKTVSFDLFSELVDDALDRMREMLAVNKAVKNYVEGAEE